MLLARLTYTSPGGTEMEVTTGMDTAQMYLDMGYTLAEEYDDGWRAADDLTPVPPRAGVEPETEPDLPAADDSEAGSVADDQEGN